MHGYRGYTDDILVETMARPARTAHYLEPGSSARVAAGVLEQSI